MTPIQADRVSYDICDDFGVWIVVPRLAKLGRWQSEQDAQAECDRRNFQDGIADESGRLLQLFNQVQWWAKHSLRPDCTCKRVMGIGGAA